MTEDSANFAKALHSGRFSTAWLWIGPSLDRRTPKSEVTAFLWCNSLKSVENILGYIREQFYRFSRGCKPRENLWNCSRKYTKMFKTDSFLDNKKLSFNQNVWRDHATMHGGLYRWRENSLPIFLFQKLKEILTRYSRTSLTP